MPEAGPPANRVALAFYFHGLPAGHGFILPAPAAIGTRSVTWMVSWVCGAPQKNTSFHSLFLCCGTFSGQISFFPFYCSDKK